MNFKYKDSTKNNFAVNLLLVMISAVLAFMGAKIFGAKVGVVVYAVAIAVCFYKITPGIPKRNPGVNFMGFALPAADLPAVGRLLHFCRHG